MKEIINLIDKYWKFDEDQQPLSNWHDKQELLQIVSNRLGKHVMPKIADRWQSNLPEPLKDEQHYDIILITGEQINNVEFWAFGGGFKPNNKKDKSLVDYPTYTVEFYRTYIS